MAGKAQPREPHEDTNRDDLSDDSSGASLSSKLGLLLLSLLVCGLIAEFFVRSFVEIDERIQIGMGGEIDDQDLSAAFMNDPECLWRLRPNVIFAADNYPLRGLISNGQGLRSGREISSVKTANERRILFLGDSVTFGWGVKQDQTFSHLSEIALRARTPEIETISINAGVPGYTLYQGLQFLESRGFDYQPDVIVMSFGANSRAHWGNLSDFENAVRLRAMRPPPLLRWSRLARFYRVSRYGGQASESLEPRPRLEVAEFRSLLDRLGRAVREHESKLVVMVEAHRANVDGSIAARERDAYQLAMLRFAARLGRNQGGRPAFVDTPAVLQRLAATHEPADIFFDEIHPTALGHAALANSLVAILARDYGNAGKD